MEIIRVGFIGTRTSRTEPTTAFFRDVLGLDEVRADPDWSILRLPTGQFDLFEVYAQDFDDERLIPTGVDAMIGFIVTDVEEAHREVAEAGVVPSPIVWASEAFDDADLEGFGWFFFAAPDGNTYVIEQVPS